MNRSLSSLLRFIRRRGGAVSAEFALVIPIMIALVLGAMNTGVMTFAFVSLHYAAEAAARCGAIDATHCATDSDTQTFAAGKYRGPSIGATFASSTDATNKCKAVTGTGTFNFVTGIASLPVTLSARACYSLQP